MNHQIEKDIEAANAKGASETRNADGKMTAFAVMCNDRTANILKDIFMPNAAKDPFCKMVIDACYASSVRKLPLNISMVGNEQNGRIAFVTTSVCTMMIMEISTGMDDTLINGMADLLSYDENLEPTFLGEGATGKRLMKLSMPSAIVPALAASLISSIVPAYRDGCGLSTDRDMVEPEDEEDDAPPTGSDAPEEESPGIVPFLGAPAPELAGSPN